jgi:spore maturation protein CgeB
MMVEKILIVGSDQVWSLEKIYLQYLAAEGIAVELFAAQNILYAYNGRSIVNKLKLRLGISGIYRTINRQLRERVGQFKPDIVWVFKGMEVLPETLKWIHDQGILLVNFNPDNPFIFSGRGSGNRYVTDSIPLYDLHFTYNLEVKRRLEDQLHLRAAFLPFGFEVSEEVVQLAAAEPEIQKVCFLGNPDKHRAAVIEKLLASGISIDLYGVDWNKFVNPHPLLGIFPPVFKEEFWKTLRRYRVQLNLMRVHNEDSHNMRSFEVPGIGGIMLAPATTEHLMFFHDGEEAYLFPDIEDCIKKAQHILALGREEAGRIRDNARNRSLAGGYSYRQRVKKALLELKDIYAQAGRPSF